MRTFFELHECSALPSNGIKVIYLHDSDFGFERSWNLVISKEATREDLAGDHRFEQPGELMWSTVLEIANCPFCGTLLLEKGDDGRQVQGRFMHIDCPAT